MSTFDDCFDWVVGEEGGYCNTPGDPGGETKYGISQRAYPDVNIASLTLDQAKAIYLTDYWNRIAGASLPAPLALVVFDSAVNNGVITSVRFLQEAVGVTADGVLGPQTLAAMTNACMAKGAVSICAEMLARRLVYMTELTTWQIFALGWSRRLFALLPQALQLAAGAATT